MIVETQNKTAADYLAEDLYRFRTDPLGFIKYIFDWGEGDLEGPPGPAIWQEELLEDVGKHRRDGKGLA